MRLFWLCIGGAVGTGARYLVSEWALRTLGPTFPFGTLLVNVVGSFLLAGLMNLGVANLPVEAGSATHTLRLALTTGVMGGFTTFSTFSFETMRFLQQGARALAVLNATINLTACLVACFLGWTLSSWLLAG